MIADRIRQTINAYGSVIDSNVHQITLFITVVMQIPYAEDDFLNYFIADIGFEEIVKMIQLQS